MTKKTEQPLLFPWQRLDAWLAPPPPQPPLHAFLRRMPVCDFMAVAALMILALSHL